MVHNCVLNLLNNTAVMCEVRYPWSRISRIESINHSIVSNSCIMTKRLTNVERKKYTGGGGVYSLRQANRETRFYSTFHGRLRNFLFIKTRLDVFQKKIS